MKKIKPLVAIVSNEPSWTYNLRREIIEALLDNGYRVALIVGYGEKLKSLIEKGCEHYDVPLERHGMNPFQELKLIFKYNQILNMLKPDVVLTYTLKPNAYAGLLCRLKNIPYIANVTGLGNPIENGGIVQKISLLLLKFGLKKAETVFCQNVDNQRFLQSNNTITGRSVVLPGSGVNTEYFDYHSYPDDSTVEFAFISRVMKPKGIDEYLEAAKYIKAKYPNTKFHICGFCEDAYEEIIKKLSDDNVIIYHGMLSDIRDMYIKTHCTVLPSYHEGMANVLLEAASTGRPVIASYIHGCQETFDEGITGLGCDVKSTDSLIKTLIKFIEFPNEYREKMGVAGRKKMEREFDRNIVIDAYLNEIKKVKTKNEVKEHVTV